MNTDSRIFVAGHKGMVGSAILRALQKQKFNNIVTASRSDLDLTDSAAVDFFFEKNDIDLVYNAAAKVGGIVGNANYPGDYILQNLSIQNNLFQASLKYSVSRHVFLGSCCIYPRDCPQPMKEKYILTGPLEPTNQPYAVAKISGIVTAQGLSKQYGMRTVCPMPINLYGPGDNWDPENSHIIPGLMRRFHFAKENGNPSSKVWGSGMVKREYMHVDDCADGIVFITDKFDNGDVVNIAPGVELTTRETAESVAKIVGYKGQLVQDASKPDGTPRKWASPEVMTGLGWKPKIDFKEGLESTYDAFKASLGKGRGL
jgi:GDP-L-fucose synthase